MGKKIYILFHTNLKLKVLTLNRRYLVNSFGTLCLSSRMCIKTQKPESISWCGGFTSTLGLRV